MSKKLIILASFLILILIVFFIVKKKINNNKITIAPTKDNHICDHCNIFLIDIDILRADELSCYGYPRETTPNLCNLAKKSLVFKNNFSTYYWTLPSIFSTITSLYPTFHQVKAATINRLDDNIPTLAETLKKNGYYTVFLGKDAKNSAFLSTENNGLKGYDLVIDTNEIEIENVINSLPKDKPWFIHIYHSNLHLPYLLPDKEDILDKTMTPPKDLPITQEDLLKKLDIYLKNNLDEVFTPLGVKKYQNKQNLGYEFNKLSGTEDEIKYLKKFALAIEDIYLDLIDKNNKADVAYLRMMYDSKLKLLDESYKNIFEKFSTKQDTITMVMSDHGENFGEHGLFAHYGDFNHSLFHVPLIIYSPKVKATEINQTSSNLDIFPTLLDLVGIPQINNLQGKSLLPLIDNQKIDEMEFAIGMYGSGIVMKNSNWSYCLPWIDDISSPMLFDVQKDPDEVINVIDQYPELAKKLFEKANLLRSYEYFISNNPKIINYSLPTNLTPEKIEKLKKEGYF